MIIESNLNRVRLCCCWVGVGLGCDNKLIYVTLACDDNQSLTHKIILSSSSNFFLNIQCIGMRNYAEVSINMYFLYLD